MRIRNAAKALVVRDGQLLLIEKREKGEGGYADAVIGEIYYALPGGGQEPGEMLPETVRRECREELGAEVAVGDVVCVYEFADAKTGVHHVHTVFRCELQSEPDIALATGLDDSQDGIAWVPIERLPDYNVYPRGLRTAFGTGGEYVAPTYLV